MVAQHGVRIAQERRGEKMVERSMSTLFFFLCGRLATAFPEGRAGWAGRIEPNWRTPKKEPRIRAQCEAGQDRDVEIQEPLTLATICRLSHQAVRTSPPILRG